MGRAGARALVEIGSGMARKTGLLAERCARVIPRRSTSPSTSRPRRSTRRRALSWRLHPTLRVRGVVGDFVARLRPRSPSTRRSSRVRGSSRSSAARSATSTSARRLRSLRAIARLMTTGRSLPPRRRSREGPRDPPRRVQRRQGRDRRVQQERPARAGARARRGASTSERSSTSPFTTRRFSASRCTSCRPARRRWRFAGQTSASISPTGERILTEISRKFTRASTERTLAQGGMELLEWIPDDGGMFALCVACASAR